MVLYAASPIAEIIRASQIDANYNGYSLNWWRENSFFFQPAVLLSYGGHSKKDASRKTLKIPDNVTVIGDSGGFEILTRRAKGQPVDIKPLDVLRWEEENCDIGMTLDLNPLNLVVKGKGKSIAMHIEPVTEKVFTERLEETCRNNQIFEDNRQNPNLKIYNVVHSGMGITNKWISRWFERVKDFKFEGWAVAPKSPGNPLKVAADTMFLYDRGIRKDVHILGISGIHALPVLVYMEQYIKNISTDSFSYGLFAIYRTHINLPYLNLTFAPSTKKHTKVPCFCPVCSKISVEDLYRTDIYGYSLIALHNLWQYLNYLKYLEALVEDKEKFYGFVKKNPRLKLAIDFVDITVEDGWETAVSKLGFVSKTLEDW